MSTFEKPNIAEKRYIESSTEYKIYKHIEYQLNISNYSPRNFFELRNYCYYGYINNLLRPKFWKLFLCYLPKNKFKTEHFLRDRRKLYHFYLEKSLEFLKDNPGIDDIINKDIARMCIKPVNTVEEEEKDSINTKNLENMNQTEHEINKENDNIVSKKEDNFDVSKTNSDSASSSIKKDDSRIDNLQEISHTNVIETKCQFLDSSETIFHRKALFRILLTFKVTNSGIGYTQGMHMVLAPIYYVFATSDDLDDQKFAEEDAFFCFFNLLSEIGENFVQEYDEDCQIGIKKKMELIFDIIKRKDPELYKILDRKGLLKTHFTFRWISLLLCSEFDIDQVIILWDKFFSDSYRFEILIYCCAAIIMLMKKAIKEGNFEECMKMLQINKTIDVLTIFTLADKIRREDSELL